MQAIHPVRLLGFCSMLILLNLPTAKAQDDDTINYVHGLPTAEDVRTPDFPEYDFQPEDTVNALSPADLPEEVVETLEEEPQYKGWRDELIVLDENTGLYWLHIRDTTTVRSYGFSEDGMPVSVRESTLKQFRKSNR